MGGWITYGGRVKGIEKWMDVWANGWVVGLIGSGRRDGEN